MTKSKAPTRTARGGLPSRVILHASDRVAAFDRRAIAAELKAAAPALAKVEFEGDLSELSGGRAFLARLGGLRLVDPRVKGEFYTATTHDLEFEGLIDRDPSQVSSALLAARLYDGERVAQAALPLIESAERSTGTLHVWATRRMLCTYAQDDLRYHGRYAVFGYPRVFSLLGLGLAPAASMEATLFARELGRRGATAGEVEAEIDRQYPEERIDIDEPSTVAGAIASTVLQAAAAASGGDTFCLDPACRLFNAHRKREMRASLLGGRMCKPHADLFGARGGAR